MQCNVDHLREQAERAWRWAAWTPDPQDRQRIEAVARDYELMVLIAVRAAASQSG